MSENKHAQTSEPITELLAKRWSPRAIDQEKRVDRQDLISILEAGRWAPSCFGDEPWRYIVWARFTDETAWEKAFQCLVKGNQAWVRRAPILIVSLADSEFTQNGKSNRWGRHDTGAASENMCLQAADLGLVAHQMGGFNVEAIHESFSVPERFQPQAMIAIGHPGDPAELPEHYQEVELARRERRPLGESFFEASWENPIK